MNASKFTFPACLLISACLGLSSCSKYLDNIDPATGETGFITTDPAISVVTATIGVAGGTVLVSKPGSPVDGLELSIQDSSFSKPQTVNISYAVVKSHEFGENFNAISPLITVELTDLYAGRPMDLKIPIKVPAGHLAMAFLYDSTSGELEGLPIAEITDNYILISSRHFSATSAGSLKSAITGEPNWNDRIIAGSVLESLTSGNLQISAGFDVGTDDWEFPNYGAYITPAGQCLGQSCLAIWYYNYCKKALGSAFHKFDTNLSTNRPDAYWFDNPKAYRFSAVIHRDIEDSKRLDGWKTLMERQMSNPGIIWKSVLVEMIIRNSPQLLFLRENATGVAHAVICYKVDLKEKKLYVADPNFPGDAGRAIPYTETSIGPYTSRSSASSTKDVVFDQVCYIQISNALDRKEMRLRWSEFENGTIGNDKFPKYKLFAGNTGGTEITDRMLVSNAEFKVVCKSEDCEASIIGTDKLQKIFIVNSDGGRIGTADDASHGIATCTLQPADNKIGIYVTGMRANGQEYYVDFKWFTINLGEVYLTITPDPLQAIADKPCSFIAEVKGTLPASYKLVWNFGDNTGDISSGTSLLVEHTFTKEGSYIITCTLYDNANSGLVARTTSKATIISSFVSELLDTKYLFVSLNADMQTDEGISLNPITIDMEYKHYNNQKIKWTGLEFFLDFKYELSGSSADPVVVTGALSGKVSADGKILESLAAFQRKELKSQTGGWREESVKLKIVPFSDHTGDATKYHMTGSEISTVVSDASITWKRQNPTSGEWETIEMRYLDYDNTSIIPTLWVDFYKY
ncbi:MAG: hypothetical protein A2X22_08975 [Bacteroidetes bacterium GWF2_49_14]|nr:MAG: hypothetical protein A2X22_08975 [Bacteroidetes bacterium GWF2_49_14]HBB91585.1 hypothetical protein [Bacteroidales bacterium]